MIPHEYGTYYLKDGWYMEMGREPLKDAVILTDKYTYKGTWKTRHDIWKKQPNIPEKLSKYIVDCCRMRETPAEIQQLMKQTMFK
ncbi:MAG: hypothetical protein K6G32_11545 [Prevotella sp.]|nr:hypothetical protein [Prevotella sp.]